MSKEGSFKPLIFVMLGSLLIAALWSQIPFLREAVHYVLDPSLGWLLNWNLTIGMLAIVLLISVISILAQKYGTDQKTLKELRAEQKKLQEEMKSVREHPEKMAELNKRQMEIFPQTMKLSTRPIMFTGIPFILLFRWFNDLFTAGSGYTLTTSSIMFLGISWNWFWFYLVFTLVFSMILRKIFRVV